MTTWVIIPAKAPTAAKGRLAGALSANDRNRLSRAMFCAALEAACGAVGKERVLIVGSVPLAIDPAISVLDEPHGGLNAALTLARSEAFMRGASRVISLAADLPLVRVDDVKALAELPDGIAGIAPDRHGTGTNALSLPVPAAQDFGYGYGVGSCDRHEAEAERLGMAMRRIDRPALARDIDEPADLADAQGLLCANKDG